MNVKYLGDIEPWQWPEDANEIFLETLQDANAEESDRILAAELAGNPITMSDEIAEALLSISHNREAADALRGQAATAFGPAFEMADLKGFDFPEDIPITESMFQRARNELRKLYMDADVPKHVRRRILEAATRASEDWHREAVRAAHQSDDEDWQVTAVFCMGLMKGFEAEILNALDSQSSNVRYEGIRAAGSGAIKAAWPRIARFISAAGEIEKKNASRGHPCGCHRRPVRSTDSADGARRFQRRGDTRGSGGRIGRGR